MRRINIRNFGPIHKGRIDNEGWIDLNKVTAFIGNNGTGKSALAKMISTLSWIEKAVFTGRVSAKELYRYKTLERYSRYHKMEEYFRPDTAIFYEGDACILHYEGGRLTVTQKQGSAKKYLVPKIMYAGSERSFLGAAPNPEKIKGLPDSLGTFLDEYQAALENLPGEVALPFSGITLKYNKHRRVPVIRNADNTYELTLSDASSGMHSATPLVLVSRYLSQQLINNNGEDAFGEFTRTRSSEEEARYRREIEAILKNASFSEDTKSHLLSILERKYNASLFLNIVEEPEQNLFPDVQQRLLYELLESCNSTFGNELMITTHSPYLISYLTFASKASDVLYEIIQHTGKKSLDSILDAEKALSAIVPSKSIISPDQLSVYELDEIGNIHLLKQNEGLPSDDHYLNQRLRAMNQQFGDLLDLEMQMEEWQ